MLLETFVFAGETLGEIIVAQILQYYNKMGVRSWGVLSCRFCHGLSPRFATQRAGVRRNVRYRRSTLKVFLILQLCSGSLAQVALCTYPIPFFLSTYKLLFFLFLVFRVIEKGNICLVTYAVRTNKTI